MISLLLPTRERRDSLDRLYQSAMDLADKPERVELVVYVDGDDQSYDSYEKERLIKVRGPRNMDDGKVNLSKKWNHCWDQCKKNVVMHCGDDIAFRTKSWDSIVMTEFEKVPDRILLVYGDDGIQHERMSTHGFYHRRWVETLGYFCPPYFSSDFNDTWLFEIGGAIGRRVYLPDLSTEHMHVSVGKMPDDQNSRDRIARHHADDVANLYRSLADKRIQDAEKLRQAIARWTG